MPTKPPINPDLLRHARESAGLIPSEAASKLGLRDSSQGAAEDRVRAWESGKQRPTRNQLERLSEIYRRPILYFFLSRVPPADKRLPDFRVVGHKRELSPLLAALVRMLQTRHDELRLLLEDLESPPIDVVASVNISSTTPAELADRIRNDLELDHTLKGSRKGPEATLKVLRGACERAGIFVWMAGNLGSHHSSVGTDEFRGMAFADPLAPLIVVNPNDAKGALVFTLVHELAHIWLGETGLSNAAPFDAEQEKDDVEAFCNQTAEELLLPEREVFDTWESSSDVEPKRLAAIIAQEFGVSHTAAAFRMRRLGLIDDYEWHNLRAEFHRRWLTSRTSASQGGGPTFYQMKQYEVGRPVVRLVSAAVNSGSLTPTRASRILQIAPTKLNALAERVLA
ncbi:MAG: XRE family transcriptional regulator [Myxococcota bacterium]